MKILTQNANLDYNKKKTDFNGLYKATSIIQDNTVLNKAILSLIGFQIPFCLSSNNKTERMERIVQGTWYMGIAYASPFLLLPFINKKVLLKSGIIEHMKDRGVEIVRVSKEFLNQDAKKMIEGIKETAKNLKKEKKFKGISDDFDKILNKFEDKELLRQKLINAHKNIFKYDFIFTSALGGAAMPWISNFYTELTTGRKGYSGEFEMAGENYTDKMAAKHEKYKYQKLALSFALSILPAFILPKQLAKSMSKNISELKGIPKFLNKNAKLFDYTDGKFMSLLTYAAIWTFGDFPVYLIATRDKNELAYLAISRSLVGLSFFGGELALSNWLGRTLDKTFKTKLMDMEKLKKANPIEKIFTPARSLHTIKNLGLDNKTKKFSVGMYWGALLLNALLLGYGIPKTLNVALKKKVEKDLKKNEYSQVSFYNSTQFKKTFEPFLKNT